MGDELINYLENCPPGTQVGWYCEIGMNHECPFGGDDYLLVQVEGVTVDEVICIKEGAPSDSPLAAIMKSPRLGLNCEAAVSFERDEAGEPHEPIILTRHGKETKVNFTDAVRQFIRDVDYYKGNTFTVWTPDIVTPALNAWAKENDYLVTFAWKPELVDHNAWYKQRHEQMIEHDKKEIKEIASVLKKLPHGAAIAWSEQNMRTAHPYATAWLDIVLEDLQEDIKMNWVWTIMQRADSPFYGDYDGSDIYIAHNAKIEYTITEEDEYINCHLIHPTLGTLDIWPNCAPGNDEMGDYYRKCQRDGGQDYTGKHTETCWTPDCINKVLSDWTKKHTGRDDLTFHWAESGEGKRLVQVAIDLAVEAGVMDEPSLTIVDGMKIYNDDGWWNTERVAAHQAFANKLNDEL